MQRSTLSYNNLPVFSLAFIGLASKPGMRNHTSACAIFHLHKLFCASNRAVKKVDYVPRWLLTSIHQNGSLDL